MTLRILKSTNPFINLAYEDYVLNTETLTHPILLLYRNLDSVIIGCNQNPWEECRVNALEEMGVNLVRRRSGGGTVYHVPLG